jgi:hypothetical protein
MDPLYFFAHHALQRRLLSETGFFERLLADEDKQRAWIEDAARQTAELTRIPPSLEAAIVDLTTVDGRDILGRPALVVELPPPQGPAHCHFVAAFRSSSGAQVRYYTLERSITAGQPMLCSWSKDGRHSLIGTGPAPDLMAFAEAVERAEYARGGGQRSALGAAPLH